MSTSETSRNWNRSKRQVVKDELLWMVDRFCTMAQYEEGRRSIVLDEDDMTEMTKCEEYPEGLSFSSYNGRGRKVLYELRDEGFLDAKDLFFTGIYGRGIAWTNFRPRGLGWRIEDARGHPLKIMRQISDWAVQSDDGRIRDMGKRMRSLWMDMKEELGNGGPPLFLEGGSSLDEESGSEEEEEEDNE